MTDIQLTATVPQEMVQAQQQLITWTDNKIASILTDAAELEAAYLHAKKSKWKTTVLYSHWQKALKKLSYYQKMLTALKAGFYIVPNFPISMFAIRTKKEIPEAKESWFYLDNHEQSAQQLSEGKGEYQNPFPTAHQRTVKKSEVKNGVATLVNAEQYFAHHWDDIEFPVTMAKPIIMEATTRAMALKCFDQIGIMPATKNDDPVIIGQIIRKSGYSTKIVSFLIAWHLNTNVL